MFLNTRVFMIPVKINVFIWSKEKLMINLCQISEKPKKLNQIKAKKYSKI